MFDMKVKFLLLICLIIGIAKTFGQQTMLLYNGAIPNSKIAANEEETSTDKGGNVIISKISIPTLTIFLPPAGTANGTAVIICPGGGYYVNAFKHEGTDVAKKFNEQGVAAFVLKYRIPDERTMVNTSIGPLQDVQQAMIIVRSHAKEWHIDLNKTGVMGFSAGGHLASTLGTHFKNVLVANPLNLSVKPDFMILAYPLISTDTAINKKGSLDKLTGKNAGMELINGFSNETQVTSATPPTFLVQATNDDLSVINSIVFYQALLKNKVPAEMHLYQAGGHGYGMNNKTTKDKWMERCINWMDANGWLKKTI